jgi:hypothetical protein
MFDSLFQLFVNSVLTATKTKFLRFQPNRRIPTIFTRSVPRDTYGIVTSPFLDTTCTFRSDSYSCIFTFSHNTDWTIPFFILLLYKIGGWIQEGFELTTCAVPTSRIQNNKNIFSLIQKDGLITCDFPCKKKNEKIKKFLDSACSCTWRLT